MIGSLQCVQSSVDGPLEASGAMKPMGSRALPRGDDPQLWQGQTTWAWEEDGKLCAVGWDWIEMQPDVLVLADPMSVVSNVEFLLDAGARPGSSKVLVLNRIIHLLPWQKDALTSIPALDRQRRRSLKSANQAYSRLLAA